MGEGENNNLEGLLQYERAQDDVYTSEKTGRPQVLLSPTPRSIRRTLFSILKRFLYALVPQLIRTHNFYDPVAPSASSADHSTAWMNSLRGLASLAVFNEHYFYFFTHRIITGYGAREADRYWHQLPVVSSLPHTTATVHIALYTIMCRPTDSM